MLTLLLHFNDWDNEGLKRRKSHIGKRSQCEKEGCDLLYVGPKAKYTRIPTKVSITQAINIPKATRRKDFPLLCGGGVLAGVKRRSSTPRRR
uniref:Uncharacterized protein n=1 Tax=Meloidogyne enterolobii TaxID=390850 RepID=A0A6V7U0F5_MELEN|nr:unnamed protein product [Meloidogyne enterolobii]